MLKLVIGNRNYSSWSLRAWLHLRESGIPFETLRLNLFSESWASDIAVYSPAGRVPVLLDGAVRVWDSAAIIQYVMERHPGAVGWPASQPARAHAQSLAAEMHSGFLAVRNELPLNIRRRMDVPMDRLSPDCRLQVDRIISIWKECGERFRANGPWLFGEFSVADIVFAPVALRFVSYGIPVPAPATGFVSAVEELPAIREWSAAAVAETERSDFIDRLVPADESPLTPG